MGCLLVATRVMAEQRMLSLARRQSKKETGTVGSVPCSALMGCGCGAKIRAEDGTGGALRVEPQVPSGTIGPPPSMRCTSMGAFVGYPPQPTLQPRASPRGFFSE